ncbi:MAG: winged helix-turn-helix domain-containing protein, partial [Hydrogenophaga sp.]|nr:winged helix-turn-helix domain-containing protein [Hydrogenophaga sp.]
YQGRMKALSGQQRKIVEYLVHYRGAATVKQIAQSCFITQQVCSGQLKQLRDKRVVRAFARGRESYYELAEPLMRLCMEVKQQRGEALAKFVVLLRERCAQTDAAPWPRPQNHTSVLAMACEERKLLEPMASVSHPMK